MPTSPTAAQSQDVHCMGGWVADVFSFLTAPNQHALRSTSRRLAGWFDAAAAVDDDEAPLLHSRILPLVARYPEALPPPSQRPAPVQQCWVYAPVLWAQTARVEPPAVVALRLGSYFSSFSSSSFAPDGDVVTSLPVFALVPAVTGGALRRQPRLACFGGLTVCVTQAAGVSVIGDDCFAQSPRLTSLRLVLPDVRAVGARFASACPSLTAVLLATPQAETIDDGFLSDNACLASVVVVAPTVRAIGHNCLAACPALTRFAAATNDDDAKEGSENGGALFCMPSVKSIGGYWLAGASSLSSISFVGFDELESVGSFWLSGCTTLATVNFAGLFKLQWVGDFWLCECPRLGTADFSALAALRGVGSNWLQCSTGRQLDIEEIEGRCNGSGGVGGAIGCRAVPCPAWDARLMPTAAEAAKGHYYWQAITTNTE